MKLRKLKKILALLAAMVLLLCGCSSGGKSTEPVVEKNDPQNLSQIPYTFTGQSGDFSVSVTVRQVTDADIALLAQSGSVQSSSVTTDGYRTVFRISYAGSAEISKLTYIFGQDTQWRAGSDIAPAEGEKAINAALNGEEELGGSFFGADAKPGGPVPPKDKTYSFEITAQTPDGEICETFTVSAK